MGFNLRLFLRRTPAVVLRSYFGAMGVALPLPVDWEAPAPSIQRTVFDALEGLTQADRDPVTVDFEHTEQLCNPAGQIMLHALAATNPRLLSEVLAAESDEARAVSVLLGHRVLFERALTLTYAGHLLNGRSWSAFEVDAPAPLRSDPESVGALERDISAIFTRLDGSGRRLKVDSFEWQAFGQADSSGARSIHYCIYAEGQPESHLEFQSDEPTRVTRRIVHQRAIVYDPDKATIDVITSGGTAVRAEIAQCFARSILGVGDGVRPIVARRFILNHLKQRPAFKFDTADRIKTVKVFLLRLAPMSGVGRVTIEIDPSDRTDIHRTSEQLFGETDPLQRSEWQVIQAKLRIVFHPERGSTRDKNVTIDLRLPNHSNIREQIRHHQVVSQKYLAMWGLVVESVV